MVYCFRIVYPYVSPLHIGPSGGGGGGGEGGAGERVSNKHCLLEFLVENGFHVQNRKKNQEITKKVSPL